MADKSVGELIAAQSVTPTDLFVLEQNGTAKKLTGQILENWLVSFADGHGGIHNIEKVKTIGLVDTYRITLADTTTFDFMVTNGKGINSVSKVSTSGLVDTYRIAFNDGTTSAFTVTNGEKGDKGDTAYIWIKYASQEPSESSNSFGDVPDDWIGVYFGFSSTAPTDWEQYKWYRIKGEKGDTGNPATLVSAAVTYQVSDSGNIIPSGTWGASIPVVPQGKHLWTKIVQTFNTGKPVTAYTVSRMGLDGLGSVVSVCGISPDGNGNVPLTAADVGALPSAGGDMTGPINMNGQPLTGLNAPAKDSDAVNLGYVQNNTAPAGFGLGQMGGELKDVTDFSQLDAIVWNGWYFIRFPEPFYIDGAFAQFFCLEVCGETSEHIHQTIHLIGSNYKLHRWCDSGVWGVVEWENPPMVPGVEYRTTERHNGRVVYAMAVSCGTMTDGTEIIFKAGANPIRYSGTSDGAALPFMSSEPYSMWVRLHTGTITFHCGAERGSANSVMVTVWYTRD